MADKKPKLPLIISPKGIAAFAHLDKPDTEGKYADGKYKVKLKLPKAGDAEQEKIDAFVKKLDALHSEARGKKKTDSPVQDGDDKDNEYDKGFWLINFKTRYQPDMRDSAKNKLPAAIKIMGGDVIRVAFQAVPYEEGKNAGISCQLQAVMLVEKRNGGGSNAGDAFEEEEDGFVSDKAAGSDDGDEEDSSAADY